MAHANSTREEKHADEHGGVTQDVEQRTTHANSTREEKHADEYGDRYRTEHKTDDHKWRRWLMITTQTKSKDSSRLDQARSSRSVD